MTAAPCPQAFDAAVTALVGAAPLELAVSGGLDSMVLLDLAARAGRASGVVHVDHGLCGDSVAWVRHCRMAAAARGLAFRSVRVDLDAGADLEARARAARHAAFQRLLPEGAVLATAHHADDQAETVLLRLLRGSGVEGLAGIAPCRDLGGVTLVRPLLGWPRAALAAYAREWGLEWVEDPSNASVEPDRNFLRHEILPRLGTRWPQLGRRFGRLAAHARETREVGDWTATQLGLGAGPSPLAGLAAAPPAVAAVGLRAWLRRAGLRPPPEARLRQGLRDLLAAGGDRQPVLRWEAGEVRRHAERLYRLPPGVAAAVPDLAAAGPYPPRPAGWLEWADAGHGRGLPEGLCARAVPEFAARGARIRLHRGGPRRRVAELFRAMGLAPWERSWWPVLHVDGAVVAIPGVGMSVEHGIRGGQLPCWRLWLPAGCDISQGLTMLLKDSGQYPEI
ncbi:tRNA lysidine(34) synthetase TilS [Arhodomonas sp. SL1]|uniref:tRNA lysidine(34) synthetase TilS n=1 Tax=Arhodomonas sp. SL1 TaxID=3425691 RepID=UPI003F884071